MKKFILFYFLAVSFTVCLFSSGWVESNDGQLYVAVAKNLLLSGKPTAPPDEYTQMKNLHFNVIKAPDGNWYSQSTGMGYSLALLPAVAIAASIHHFYNVPLPNHFPLQSDWPLMFFASFTNCFFAGFLTTIMFLYLRLLKFSKKISVMFSLLTLFTTNLFPLSKDAFAHMMFITFMMGSFYFIKLAFVKRKMRYLLLSGISLGITIITYNTTYILILPALLFYLIAHILLLSYFRKKTFSWYINSTHFKKTVIVFISPFVTFLVGLIPFLFLNRWFNALRFIGISSSEGESVNYLSYLLHGGFHLNVFIDGLDGQLISPGRSFFLYSPLIILTLIFWYKLRRSIALELVVTLLLAALYLFLYSSFYSTSANGISEIWPGESSWGPRYLSPLIPFAMILVTYVYVQLSKAQRFVVFIPLLIFAFYVQILGTFLPYEIKYQGLPRNFFINGFEYTYQVYPNFLPQYSALYMMSKQLAKHIKDFPSTIEGGAYNVKFYDGIYFPFPFDNQIWRAVDKTGYISFSNIKNKNITLSFILVNQPNISQASSSAFVHFTLNGHTLNKSYSLPIRQHTTVILTPPSSDIQINNNILTINVNATKNSDQSTVMLQALSINNTPTNIKRLNVPYVSALDSKIMNIHYNNWGNSDKNPWDIWDIHTEIYDNTFDFWWLRPMYYWDLPGRFFISLFVLDISIVALTVYELRKLYKKIS